MLPELPPAIVPEALADVSAAGGMTLAPLAWTKKWSVLVADSCEIDKVAKHKVQGATTNPSLLLQACRQPQYSHFIDEAVKYANDNFHRKKDNYLKFQRVSIAPQDRELQAKVAVAVDKLMVDVGKELLKVMEHGDKSRLLGKVSTEIDAILSFDKDGSVLRAKEIIEMYKEVGVDKSNILIKLASTWEGIKAMEELEKEGIQCNMTLCFSAVQAAAAAEHGATVVSPFVGRVFDFFQRKRRMQEMEKGTILEAKELERAKGHYCPSEDAGVGLVKEIYQYFKKNKINTKVLGASFRNTAQIIELVGCDLLTISPTLLDELYQMKDVKVQRKLDEKQAEMSPHTFGKIDEKTFRWLMNENEAATELLRDGIARFAADLEILEKDLKFRLNPPHHQDLPSTPQSSQTH